MDIKNKLTSIVIGIVGLTGIINALANQVQKCGSNSCQWIYGSLGILALLGGIVLLYFQYKTLKVIEQNNTKITYSKPVMVISWIGCGVLLVVAIYILYAFMWQPGYYSLTTLFYK